MRIQLLKCLFYKVIFAASSLGAVLIPAVNAFAQGNLLITPMRVVLDGKKKMQELNLANTGTDTARYLISFIEMRMKEDGTFEKITEPDSAQRFASHFIRYFPRSVVLPPNEAQVVKLQLINTSALSEGEYRSHIYFRAEPDPLPLGNEMPASAEDSGGISVRLTPVFGLSIPVIIRNGDPTGQVNISDLSLVRPGDGPPGLNMTFNRSGNTSVYGDIAVNYISSQGKSTLVANIKGLAVYTPNQRRKLRVPLAVKPGIDYRRGKLVVLYTESTNGITSPLARAELSLP